MAKKRFSDFTEEPRTEPQYPLTPAAVAVLPVAVEQPAPPASHAAVAIDKEPTDVKEPKAVREKKAAPSASERSLPRLGRKPVYEVAMQPFSSRISQDRAEEIADLARETGKPITRLLDEALTLLLRQYRNKKAHEN
jgi:hypothetical protein